MGLIKSILNSDDDGVHLSESFFNHSCSPNCEVRGQHHAVVCTSVDIKTGEELNICYMQLANLDLGAPRGGR